MNRLLYLRREVPGYLFLDCPLEGSCEAQVLEEIDFKCPLPVIIMGDMQGNRGSKDIGWDGGCARDSIQPCLAKSYIYLYHAFELGDTHKSVTSAFL